MLELGEHETEAHQSVGVVAGRNVDRLYLIGELMTKYAAEGAMLADMPAEAVVCCTSHTEIAGLLHRTVTEGDVILIKGSRGMTMENVATELKNLMQHAKGE